VGASATIASRSLSEDELAARKSKLTGDRALQQFMAEWLGLSFFAPVPRMVGENSASFAG